MESNGASGGLNPEVIQEGTNQVWNWTLNRKLDMNINKRLTCPDMEPREV
jgi:hypothetical protein